MYLKRLLKHWIFIIFTLLYFIFALLTYKDYGITFDEKVEYDAGRFLLQYYTRPATADYIKELIYSRPANIEERHLPPFSVYSRIYPALINILNPNYYFEWFHLQNMFLGYFLFLFAYLLFFLHYKNPYKALVAPIFIAVTPTIFGLIPANPKDIPFATIYLLGILAIYLFSSRKMNSYVEISVLGIVFGLAQSQRVVGVTLIIGYIFSKFIREKNIRFAFILNFIIQLFLIFCVSLVVWVISLPFLGVNLPANLVELQFNAAKYTNWNHEIVYFGQYLTREQRPWHYLFVYLVLQMPLFTLLSLTAGTLFVLFKKIVYNRQHPVVLISLLFVINSVIYLLLHPIVYNGIRHFLYLVICITLIAGYMFVDMMTKLKTRKNLLLFPVTISLVITVIRMGFLHPYEYIYFNELTGGLKNIAGKFDTEYWGAAYKEGAEYIRDNISTQVPGPLKVYSCGNQFAVVYYSQFRFTLVGSSKEADVILCELHKDNLRHYDEAFPVIKTIQRENTTIFRIRVNKNFLDQQTIKTL